MGGTGAEYQAHGGAEHGGTAPAGACSAPRSGAQAPPYLSALGDGGVGGSVGGGNTAAREGASTSSTGGPRAHTQGPLRSNQTQHGAPQTGLPGDNPLGGAWSVAHTCCVEGTHPKLTRCTTEQAPSDQTPHMGWVPSTQDVWATLHAPAQALRWLAGAAAAGTRVHAGAMCACAQLKRSMW